MTHPDRWRLDRLLTWEERRMAMAEAALMALVEPDRQADRLRRPAPSVEADSPGDDTSAKRIKGDIVVGVRPEAWRLTTAYGGLGDPDAGVDLTPKERTSRAPGGPGVS